MRIVLQGSMSPKQLGEAVKEIVTNTLEKVEMTGKRQVLHNAVIEFNLNVKGQEAPVLIVDDERNTMLTIHSGIKNGELVEYVEPDRTELLEKFDELVKATEEEA